MTGRLRSVRLLLCAGLALLGSCQGDTVYLGDEPARDGGQERRDAGREPCIESADCESDERPYCNLGTRRCVECLRDWQCESGRCRNEEWGGECVPAPLQ